MPENNEVPFDVATEGALTNVEKYLATPTDEFKPEVLKSIEGTKTALTKFREAQKLQAEKSKAPEKYDLKLSEKTLVDPARLQAVQEKAKTLKLTQEQASLLVAHEEEGVTAYLTGEKAKYEKQVNEAWPAALKADPDYGGANFQKNDTLKTSLIARVDKAIPGFQKFLEDTGSVNRPEVAKALAWIAGQFDPKALVLPKETKQEAKTNPDAPIVNGKQFFGTA